MLGCSADNANISNTPDDAGEGAGGGQEGVHQLGRGLLQEEPGLPGQHQQDSREDAAHQGARSWRSQRRRRIRSSAVPAAPPNRSFGGPNGAAE
jgi:hypothetical protein